MITMYHIKTITRIKFLIIILSFEGIQCTIDGSLPKPKTNKTRPGDEPCNPLYWYPRNIPEYCNYRSTPTPSFPGPEFAIPIPIPVPVPPPLPIPMPVLPPPVVPPLIMPAPPPMPPGPPTPPIMVPNPIMPLPIPLPFGIPLAPTNPMVPVAGIPIAPPPPPPAYPVSYPPPYPPYPPAYPSPFPAPIASPFPGPYPPPYTSPYLPPYPYNAPFPMPPRSGMGMVPGIPGIVSPDGGINILPFSDAYSDMLEKHKQKMIRKRLQKLLNKYESHPWKSRRKTRRHNVKQSKEGPEEKMLDENTILE